VKELANGKSLSKMRKYVQVIPPWDEQKSNTGFEPRTRIFDRINGVELQAMMIKKWESELGSDHWMVKEKKDQVLINR
jgi:hypothetical protein